MNHSQEQLEARVLVLAPTARDADVTQALLLRAGLNCAVCQTVSCVAKNVAAGVGAVLTTEEAISADGIDELLDLLKQQPPWSKVPVVVLIQGAARSPTSARILQALENVTLLDRPAPMRTVISAVQAALRERRRQYQIRDQMEEIQRLLRTAEAARAEAEKASRLKDEFLATVSHELRTPLSAMLLWAKMLSTGRLAEKDRTDAVDAIVRSAQAQRQLIEDLLDMARIMSGKLRMELRDTALGIPVRAAVDAVRPVATIKRVTMVVDLDGEAAAVRGDADRLQQVAWNLLTNAVKFTPEGGRVDVRVTSDAARGIARLTVTDTGKGISADFLPYVFERFRQADASSTRAYGGLGLGLAIVRELVELHGGSIRVQSDGEGKGATFTIELPLLHGIQPRGREAPLEKPACAFDNVQQLAGVRVLLIEDEAETRKALVWLLNRSGAQVTSVANAAAAIEDVQRHRPDVLVSDIGLPGVDGYTLLDMVHRHWAQRGERPAPALALTAYARGEDRERALAAGFQAYAAKPVEPEEFVKVVAGLAGRASAGIGSR